MTVLFLATLPAQASKLSDDSQNTFTRYKGQPPAGVCFEKSEDTYTLKKNHTVSELMMFFSLKPLWCESCSLDTTQALNHFKNIDSIDAGSTVMIPKRCSSFSWVDPNKDKPQPTTDDPEINAIIKARGDFVEKNSDAAVPEPPASHPSKITSVTPVRPKKKFVVTYNKLSVEPLLLYSELSGTNPTATSKIRGTGTGVGLSYTRNLEARSDAFVSLAANQLRISEASAQALTASQNQTYLAFLAGYRYYLNADWSLSGAVGYRENLFYLTQFGPVIQSVKTGNYGVSLSPSYRIWSFERLSVLADAAISALLPVRIGSETTNTGSEYGFGVRISHKQMWGRLFGGMTYSERLQKTNTADFNEKILVYAAGLTYLF